MSLTMLAALVVPAPQAHAATTITVAGFDVTAIEAAIAQAVAGDTVFFPGGVYNLSRAFVFKSQVNYVGSAASPPVLTGQGTTSLQLQQPTSTPLRDVTIRGLHFDNIELRFVGNGSHTSFVNLTLKDCLFRNGTGTWDAGYLLLTRTVNATVDGCTFLRDSAHGGRGLLIDDTRVTVVKDSFFGTTRNLESGTPNGYFKTAINVFGYDVTDTAIGNRGVYLDGNVLRRKAGITAPEDHGIYAWGTKELHISRNHIDGWTDSSSGASAKLRNGEDYFMVGNHLMTSAVFTYTHWGPEQMVQHLYRLRVSGNRIDMLGSSDTARGTFYRRVDTANASSSGPHCSVPGGEDDLYFLDNRFINGGVLSVRCTIGSEVCVQGNVNASLNFNGLPVRTGGCAVPSTWDSPLIGIHRGDFNGDGKQDFAHRVDNSWRMHLSNGDGFTSADWGNDANTATDTERYGVHVADFNGDGFDDIAYYGNCGTPSVRCWRVQRSTGAGFFAARGFGDDVRVSAETFRFGFHTGDFTGDGRADIAFRGLCGNDNHACWRVLMAQPDSTFAARDFGDAAFWHPTESEDFGLLVGDFNGDGRDDIAYRGLCGTPATDCIRVHRSFPDNTFSASDWGDNMYFDGPVTPHFGMRVGDFNADGRADIAYRGRCGSPGVAQWRYHVGADTYPFTISCSATYRF
ncbi:MAG TPA: FG-GAP-like repeat-containing protein [Candidatus Limnocylindrales bacterium]